MKVCCVFNYNPLYRYPIYSAMAEKFDCDFYFGDTVFEPLKSFDANKLKGFKGFIKAKKTKFKSFVWHSNIAPIFNRKYSHYILTGDSSMIVNWLIILYAKISGKKVFLWTHGVNSRVEKTTTRILLKAFYGLVEGVLLYSEHARPYMIELGCKERKMHYIHNSLDTEEQTRLYKNIQPTTIYRNYFNNSNPVVLYIGRIQKRKKVDQLVNAIAKLKDERYYVNLVIVGNVTDDNSIGQCVKDNNLDNQVWFYGPSYDEVNNAELLYNADVCVSPGNVGLTSIHSLSYGTPVLSNNNFETQMPEYTAIIPGVTGDFFVENSIEDMARFIKKWTNINAEKRHRCREMARKIIEEEWSVGYQINILSKVLV